MTKLIPTIILITAALLRFFQLNAAQFWYDEAFSAILARQSIPALIQATAADNHPPLSYLVFWLANHLPGQPEIILRLPSLIFSVLAIWLLWRIGLQLKSSNAVTWSAMAFMAITPFQVFFGQEVRMYALLQVLVLAWLLCVLKRRWDMVPFIGGLALYTHNYAIFYCVVMATIAVIGELRRPVVIDRLHKPYPALVNWQPGDESQLKWAIGSHAIALMIYAPWAASLAGQMSIVASGYWIESVTPGSVIDALVKLCLGFYVPDMIAAAGVLVVCGMLIYAVITARKSAPHQLYLLAFLPFVLSVMASIVWHPIFLFRGFIACAPAIYLLVAQAFSSSRRAALVGAFLIIPIITVALVGYYPGNIRQKGDQSYLIQMIRDRWEPGDIVYHASDSTALRWLAYAPDIPMAIRPECVDDRTVGSLSPATRAALNFPIHRLDELTYTRAWLIWSAGPTASRCEHRELEALTSNAQLIADRSELFAKGGIWLLEH